MLLSFSQSYSVTAEAISWDTKPQDYITALSHMEWRLESELSQFLKNILQLPTFYEAKVYWFWNLAFKQSTFMIH